MNAAASRKVVPFERTACADEAEGPIPAGEYAVAYIGHHLTFMFNTGKVFIRFRIVAGEYAGRELYRAFNVKMKNKRHFTVAQSSALYREFCTLSGRRERRDRIDLCRLRNTVIRANVRVVTHDQKQRVLPLFLQYSVVGELLSLEAGTVA
jgi:hypothetical protein